MNVKMANELPPQINYGARGKEQADWNVLAGRSACMAANASVAR